MTNPSDQKAFNEEVFLKTWNETEEVLAETVYGPCDTPPCANAREAARLFSEILLRLAKIEQVIKLLADLATSGSHGSTTHS